MRPFGEQVNRIVSQIGHTGGVQSAGRLSATAFTSFAKRRGEKYICLYQLKIDSLPRFGFPARSGTVRPSV